MRILKLFGLIILLFVTISSCENNKERKKLSKSLESQQSIKKQAKPKKEILPPKEFLPNKEDTKNTSIKKVEKVDVFEDGNEVLFETEEGDFTYRLFLKQLINDKTISCNYNIYSKDSLILSTVDIVNKVENTSSSGTGKFGYRCQGKYYKSNSSSKYIWLIIDKNESLCVCYKYKDPQHSNFPQWPLKTPLLFRKGMEEPYDKYLYNTIESLFAASFQLKENPENEIFKTKYDNLYNDAIGIINLLDTSKIEYDYKRDTMLLDMSIHYGIDSLIDVLRNKGLKNRELVSSSTIQKIHKDSIKYLKVLVKFDQRMRLLSSRFENISYIKKREYNKRYALGYRPFYTGNYSFKEFGGDKYLLTMHDDGFENISHLFTVWRKEKEYYQLEKILDRTINVSIGGIQLTNIIDVDEDTKLLIGETMGGDGGYSWGSFWLASITSPNFFDVIYEHQRSGDEFKGEYFKYVENLADSTIYLTKVLKYFDDNIKKDSLIMRDTIQYNVLLEKNKRL